MSVKADIISVRHISDIKTATEKYNQQRLNSIRNGGGIYNINSKNGLLLNIIDCEAFKLKSTYKIKEIEGNIPLLFNPFKYTRSRGDEKNTDVGFGKVREGER